MAGEGRHMTAAARTAYAYDPRFLGHDTGIRAYEMPSGGVLEAEEHPSSARITRRTAQLIDGSGIRDALIQVDARPATIDEIAVYHTRDYIEQVRRVAEAGGGALDRETPIAPASWEAALLAAGAGIELSDAVLTSKTRNAYGLLRPPGHHAMADKGMGFCIFNNVVIAVRHAQRTHGIGKVAVIDWDVHHGNGTQAAFWDDPSVLFVSLHQDGWYPQGWGAVHQSGGEHARGSTLNVPLPPGSGNRAYLMAFERVVIPAIRAFAPEMIYISAGQDANMRDPLGRMLVTGSGFRAMATLLRGLADEICDGRLVGVQEGGYSAFYVPYCTLAVLEGITGVRTTVPDPQEGDDELEQAEQDFRPDQEQAVEAARRR